MTNKESGNWIVGEIFFCFLFFFWFKLLNGKKNSFNDKYSKSVVEKLCGGDNSLGKLFAFRSKRNLVLKMLSLPPPPPHTHTHTSPSHTHIIFRVHYVPFKQWKKSIILIHTRIQSVLNTVSFPKFLRDLHGMFQADCSFIASFYTILLCFWICRINLALCC